MGQYIHCGRFTVYVVFRDNKMLKTLTSKPRTVPYTTMKMYGTAVEAL